METGKKLNSQERMLVIIEKLVGGPVEGMSNKALARELGTLEANICRDLQILERRGWTAARGREMADVGEVRRLRGDYYQEVSDRETAADRGRGAVRLGDAVGNGGFLKEFEI